MTTFSASRHYAVAPAAIYAAFQDGARLARWWGPAGFTNRFEVFEFTPGGRWIFTMIGPDGREYANVSHFSQLETARKVVIEHTGEPVFTLSITLHEAEGGTTLDWEQCLVDDAVAEAIRHIVEPANQQNLDRLGAELGL